MGSVDRSEARTRARGPRADFRRLRRHFVRLALAIVGGVVLYLAYFFAEGTLSERALEKCGQTQRQTGTVITVEWRWWTPGYVCVFLDDSGRVVEKRPP